MLALSESAWLGERGGVARGAGLRALWPGWLPAEPGRCGRLPSASGCGLSRRVLASLWRGEASGCRGGRSCAADAAAEAADRGEASGVKAGRSCAAGAGESRAARAVLANGSCCRAGRSCAAGAAESRAARTSATLFGGGVLLRPVEGRPHVAPTGGCRVVCSWLAWWLGGQRGRPLLGVFARLVWAALA